MSVDLPAPLGPIRRTKHTAGKARSIHLRISSAATWSTAGNTVQVVELSGFGSAGLLVCADAFSPQIARSLAQQGARALVSSAAWRLWPGRRVGGCKLGCWTSLVRSQPRRLGQFLELLKQRERRGVSRRARIQPVLSGKHDLSDRVGLRSQPSGILFPLGRTVVPMTKAAAANIRRSRSRRLRASHRRPRLLWLRRLLYEALPRQADRPRRALQ